MRVDSEDSTDLQLQKQNKGEQHDEHRKRTDHESIDHSTLNVINPQDALAIHHFQPTIHKLQKRRIDEDEGIELNYKRSMKNKVILDPTTTLTAEEFKQMRDGYESGVRKRVKEAKERKRMKIAKEKANQLLFGVPTSCLSFIFFFFF